MNSGKQTRNYKGTLGDDGTLVRVRIFMCFFINIISTLEITVKICKD